MAAHLSGVFAAATLDRALIIVLFTAGFGLLFLLAVALLFMRKKAQARSPLGLVGREAEAVGDLSPEGFVHVDGELWPARLTRDTDAADGCRKFRVVGAHGHYLKVEPLRTQLADQ